MSLINDALKRANEAQKKRAPAAPLQVPLQPVPSPQQRSLLPTLVLPVILLAVLGGSFWLIRTWWVSRPTAQSTAAAPVLPQTPAPAPAISVTAARPQTSAPVHNAPVAKMVEAPAAPPKPAPRQAAALTTPAETVVPPKPNVTTPVAEVLPAPRPKPAAAVPAAIVTPAPDPVVAEVSKPAPAPAATAAETPKPAVTPAPVPAPVVTPPPPPEFPAVKLQGIFYRLTRPSALISGKTVFVGEKVMGAKVIEIDRQSVTLEFNGQKKTLSFE